MEYIIDKLADFSYSLEYGKLPDNVKRKLQICVMDAIECCLSDMSDSRTEAALASIRKGAELPSLIFGTSYRAEPEDAAFYNTVKGAVTSRNDSSRTAICHPGSILIPLTFALAEKNNSSGKEVLEALVCGYETMIRLGAAFVSSRINGSWRNTSIVAPFGAAFAAAKMMGLDASGIASAASFSCHAAGGVNEWAVAGTGEDIFQNGWGARNGILAANLAKAGAFGCRSILEGKSGLLNAFGAESGIAELTKGLGTDYLILEIMHKPIDSCFIVQGPSQAAKKLVDIIPNDVSYENVSEVEIRVSEQAKNYPGCDNTESISSLVQGIMSIALGVSSVIVNKSTEHIRWAPPIDERILSLMHKCKIVADPDMTASYPRLQGAEIIIKTDDGRVFSVKQDDVEPLTDREVERKFLDTSRRRLGEEKADKLHNLIISMDLVKDMHEMTELLIL